MAFNGDAARNMVHVCRDCHDHSHGHYHCHYDDRELEYVHWDNDQRNESCTGPQPARGNKNAGREK